MMKRKSLLLFLAGFASVLIASAAPLLVLSSGGNPNYDEGGGVSEAPSSSPILINCGGNAYTDASMNEWAADTDFTGGSTFVTTQAIAGTTDDYLDQTERYGSFSYAITAANDTYTVTLGLTELYFTTAASRVFTVNAEGVAVTNLTGYDIIADGHDRYTTNAKSFEVVVADGVLNLTVTNTTDVAKIGWIKIEATVASAPAAVSDLVAMAGDDQITYTFTPSSGATQHNLFYSTSSPVTTGDTEVSNISSGHVLSGLTNAQIYYAAVQEENGTGTSALSNEVSATPTDPSPSPAGIVYYVATNGNDSTGDGSISTPWATIAKARDVIRSDTGRTTVGGPPAPGWEGATIYLRAGTYYLTSALTFDDRDSGNSSFPYTISAYPAETVRVTGATAIGDGTWATADGDGGFGSTRLPDAAGTYYVAWTVGSMSNSAPPLLIDDGVLVKWSTFPNGANIQSAGSWHVIDQATDSGSGSTSTFRVPSATPAGWNETGQDIRIFGFLGQDWAGYWNSANGLAPTTGGTTVTINSRRGSYVTTNNQHMRFFNIMEQLTAGLCVYADTQNRYYYKPSSGAPTNVDIGTLTTMLQLGVDESPSDAANFITFADIQFDGCRGTAIQIYECDSIIFDTCIIGPNGGTGVLVDESTNVDFNTCTVADNTKDGIIFSSCGTKTTLTNSGCGITGGTISGNSWAFDGQGDAAVRLEGSGCGLTVSGVSFTGNYQGDVVQDASAGWPLVVLDSNAVTGGATMGSDLGAFYMGRSLTAPGCEITNNTFTNFTALQLSQAGDVFGIYLDDCFSWVTITDNVFVDCDHAMQLAAGKGLIVRRNKFTGCNSSDHDPIPVLFAGRQPWGTGLSSVLEASLATYASLSAFVAYNSDIERFKVGGNLNSLILHFWETGGDGLVFLDNMNTENDLMIRINRPTQDLADIDITQLNYAPASSGTPTNGGGDTPISEMYY